MHFDGDEFPVHVDLPDAGGLDQAFELGGRPFVGLAAEIGPEYFGGMVCVQFVHIVRVIAFFAGFAFRACRGTQKRLGLAVGIAPELCTGGVPGLRAE